MTKNRSYGSLEKHFPSFRVSLVLQTEACSVLHTVFCWGCDRDRTKTVKDYLQGEKNMSKRDYKKQFNKTMRQKIKDDPSGDTFDISLLYACIKTTCKGLAEEGSEAWTKEDDTKLEYLCTEVKNLRGDVMHETKVIDEHEMKNQIIKIEILLTKCLQQAGSFYKCNSTRVTECIKEMKKGISNIINAPLQSQSVEQYKKGLCEMKEYHKRIIKDGISELRASFMNLSAVDPASWFARDEKLQAKAVFTRLDIVKEKQNLLHPEAISYEDLLTLQIDEKRPSIVVVEGEAGAGKTTLGRLMMSEWASLPDVPATVRGLEDYEIVLHLECRNKHISKFEDLLLVLMPTASCYLRNSDLVCAVLDRNVLLIADGLDEGNVSSEKLLSEIVSVCIPRSKMRLRMVLTTRPEKLSKLPHICHNLPWLHTRLTGIAAQRRSEFVSRLHEEMISKKRSKQDTQGLVDFLKQSQARIGDHYRLPLILTLLTYLWAYDPARVNPVTSSTKLYSAFHEMVQQRLLDRISEYGFGITESLKDKCEKFLQVLYEVSLITLSSNSVNLSDSCSERLTKICQDYALPPEEMCAAFLALDRMWTTEGYKTQLAAPHKSIMEFYSALHLFYRMFIHTANNKFESELCEFLASRGKSLSEVKEYLAVSQNQRKEMTLQECVDDLFDIHSQRRFLSDYQNVFIYFGGLLVAKKPESLVDLSSEFVELLKLSRISGARWLDVISEADCHDEFTRHVARKISLPLLIIRDGHTRAAIELFKHLDVRIPMRIILDCEVQHIPYLTNMLKDISERDCDIELFLNHQWKDSDYGTSDNLLGQIINKRCRLSHFTGNLENCSLLPDTVEKLKCTINDSEHAKSVCSGLQDLTTRLNLEYLGVHIVAGVDPELLRSLPVVRPLDGECGTIWLSNVTDKDVDWACNVARVLLPESCKYSSILFPRSNLSTAKCRELISRLSQLRIQIQDRGAVKVSSNNITHDEEIRLRFFTRDKLNCEFHSVDESSIW